MRVHVLVIEVNRGVFLKGWGVYDMIRGRARRDDNVVNKLEAGKVKFVRHECKKPELRIESLTFLVGVMSILTIIQTDRYTDGITVPNIMNTMVIMAIYTVLIKGIAYVIVGIGFPHYVIITMDGVFIGWDKAIDYIPAREIKFTERATPRSKGLFVVDSNVTLRIYNNMRRNSLDVELAGNFEDIKIKMDGLLR